MYNAIAVKMGTNFWMVLGSDEKNKAPQLCKHWSLYPGTFPSKKEAEKEIRAMGWVTVTV